MGSRTKEIAMPRRANTSTALDDFIARKAEIDGMLERLTHCVAIISTSAPARSTGAMPEHPPTTPNS
jgi:hypothetical protein